MLFTFRAGWAKSSVALASSYAYIYVADDMWNICNAIGTGCEGVVLWAAQMSLYTHTHIKKPMSGTYTTEINLMYTQLLPGDMRVIYGWVLVLGAQRAPYAAPKTPPTNQYLLMVMASFFMR